MMGLWKCDFTMFEFLFKRPGENKPGEAPAAQPGQAEQQTDAPANTQRALQADKLRQVDGDETAAVEFILQCEFSELRLAAAEFVHTPAQLERVRTAMRNTDRRVAKLMQARLEAIRHHESEQRRARAAIEQAEALLKDELLTPNHVAELDRNWSVIAAPELAGEFDAIRVQLAQRLEAQMDLQRAMRDRLAALRALETAGLPADEVRARLAQLVREQDAALAQREHASLPRALVAEFGNEYTRIATGLATLEEGQAAAAARDAQLQEWQSAAPASLDADALRKAWHKLPPTPRGPLADEQQQRFDALLASLPQPERKPKGAETKPLSAPRQQKGADQHFLDTLDALEAALLAGSLGTAAELDKQLRDSRDKGMRLTQPQADRLAHVRAELKRLSDWARWGGNVSREELIKAAETLPTQQLPMSELARKVGSLRERWKALDASSGAAPRSLWERFDAACTAAYAPAAAHFRHQADERHANAARGQALLDEAHAEIGRLESGAADWRHVAGTVQRLRTAWSHLGAIDRKEKKRLDHDFAEVLNTLQGPLGEQRRAEMARREELIEEVNALDPHNRHVVDALREIQHRWQEHARALPLERKDEQALWQRFRTACDALFNSRKETAHALDAERRAHESVKEAICARLEAAAADATTANAGKLLREAAAEWHAAGPVPRAHEARLEKRYHDAIAQLQHNADTARRAAGLAQASALRDRLRLVHELEAAIADPAIDAAATDWQAPWESLPPVAADYEQVLRERFGAALAATAPPESEAYGRLLALNRPRLLQDLLRLEIIAGVDSGPEFARERLKLQVEVLQSSLKSGHRPATTATELRQLCALPALTDARTASRIEHLLMRLAKEGR